MTKSTHQQNPPEPRTHLDANKNAFVRGTFITTADHNYITARWCFAHQMNIDFFWLSVHALEKYMKAVLLLNGMSSRNYQHDLPKLYKSVQSVIGMHLPDTLDLPDELKHVSEVAWIDEAPDEFMDRLYKNGNAHNRYLTYGFVRHMADIHKVDAMVFRIRRLCRKIKGHWAIVPENAEDQGPSNDFILKSNSSYWAISQTLPLERAYSGKDDRFQSGEEMQRILLNLNYAFAPEGYKHEHTQLSLMISNSEIPRALRSLEHAGGDEGVKADDREMGKWLLDNVQLPDEAKDYIIKLITR